MRSESKICNQIYQAKIQEKTGHLTRASGRLTESKEISNLNNQILSVSAREEENIPQVEVSRGRIKRIVFYVH